MREFSLHILPSWDHNTGVTTLAGPRVVLADDHRAILAAIRSSFDGDAVCAVLLFSATLCVRSLFNASSIDPGFDTQNIAVATFDAGSLGYGDVEVEAFYRELASRIRALPGVSSKSYVNHLPLDT
jgi:hypothetical protein